MQTGVGNVWRQHFFLVGQRGRRAAGGVAEESRRRFDLLQSARRYCLHHQRPVFHSIACPDPVRSKQRLFPRHVFLVDNAPKSDRAIVLFKGLKGQGNCADHKANAIQPIIRERLDTGTLCELRPLEHKAIVTRKAILKRTIPLSYTMALYCSQLLCDLNPINSLF